jgi:hypothetical protein
MKGALSPHKGKGFRLQTKYPKTQNVSEGRERLRRGETRPDSAIRYTKRYANRRRWAISPCISLSRHSEGFVLLKLSQTVC